MRRFVAGFVGLGLFLAVVYAAGQGRRPAADDASRVAREFGVPGKAWRFAPKELDASGFRFAVHDRGDGQPCMAYELPGRGGGACFVAVDDGGWAVEARVLNTPKGTIVIGATVLETHTVRLGTAGRVRPDAVSERFGVRFFAAPVPQAALRIHPNEIVSLDAGGRLLGRQHHNDGRGRFGRRDGLWERAFDRRSQP